MYQANLFKDIPDTSVIAYQKEVVSGRKAKLEKDVLALMKVYPDSTSRELGHYSSEYDCFQIARALSSMQKKGFVRKGDRRKCKLRGSLMYSWEVILNF